MEPGDELPILKKKESKLPSEPPVTEADELPILKKKEKAALPSVSALTEQPTNAPSVSAGGTSGLTTGASVQQNPLLNLPGQISQSKINELKDGVLVEAPAASKDIVPEENLSPVTSHQTTGDVNTTGGKSFENSTTAHVLDAVTNNPVSKAVGKGAIMLGASLARTPAFLSDVTNKAINILTPGNIPDLPTNASDINNPLASGLESMANTVGAENEKEFPKSSIEYFSEGEYKKGFKKLGLSVAETLPVTLSLMAGNAAGVSGLNMMAASTPVFAAQERQNLKTTNPEMSNDKMMAVSLLSGALEGATESLFGNVKLGQLYAGIVKKEGAEAAKTVVGDGLKDVFKEALKKYAGNAAEEMASEMSNQYLDNLNHIYIGGDDKVKPFDGVMEAGLIALASSNISTPAIALDIARKRADAKKAQELADQQKALKETIAHPEVNQETKDEAKKILEKSFKEEDELSKKISEEHASLPDEKKKEVDELAKKENSALKASQDPNISEEARNTFHKEAEDHSKQIDKIYEDAKSASKEKNKPLSAEEKDNIEYLNHIKETLGLKDEAALEHVKKTLDLTDEQAKRLEEANKNAQPKAEEEGKAKTKENAVQEQTATESVLRDTGVRGESGLSGVEQHDKPEVTTKQSEKVPVKEEKITPAEEKKPEDQVIPEGTETEVQKLKRQREEQKSKKTETPAVKETTGPTTEETVSENKNPSGPIQEETVTPQKESPVVTKKEEPAKGDKVKISGKEFMRTVDEKGVATYTGVKDGVELPKDTEKYRQLEESRRSKNSKVETPVVEEEKPVEQKVEPKQKTKEDLTDEEDLVAEAKDDKASVEALNRDIAAMKAFDKKDLVEKKYTGMIARAWKMKHEKKISRATYLEYKKKANEILGGKSRVDREEAIAKVHYLAEDIKKKLKAEGYENVSLNTSGPTVDTVIDAARDLITHGINAGFNIKEAVDKALEAIKKHPAYKKLQAAGNFNEEEFQKKIREGFPEEKEEPKPKKDIHGEKREHSISKRRVENEDKFKDISKRIKEKGIDYDSIDQGKATSIVNQIIDEYEKENALTDLADALINSKSDIPYAIQGLAAAKTVDRLNVIAEKETNEFTKNATFDKAAELDMWWADESTKAGQFNGVANQAISQSLPSSKAGLRTFAKKEIEKLQNKVLTDKQKESLDRAAREINEMLSEDDFTPSELDFLNKLVGKKIKEISEDINGKEKTEKITAFTQKLRMPVTEC